MATIRWSVAVAEWWRWVNVAVAFSTLVFAMSVGVVTSQLNVTELPGVTFCAPVGVGFGVTVQPPGAVSFAVTPVAVEALAGTWKVAVAVKVFPAPDDPGTLRATVASCAAAGMAYCVLS